MKFRRSSGEHARRGSVLVPVVAAITILSLCGLALSQSFSAQRMQSVLTLQASRAFWTAEAGSWHAAAEGAKLAPAVAFDQGFYVTEDVAGSAGEYVTKAENGQAVRRAPMPGPLFQEPGSGTGSGPGATSPIDEGSTSASATDTANREFTLLLENSRTYPAVLESISFTVSDPSQGVSWVEYDGTEIWRANGQAPTSPAELNLNDTDPAIRVVEPSPPLELTFRVSPRPRDTDDYTLVLRFTDGTSSTLRFSVQW